MPVPNSPVNVSSTGFAIIKVRSEAQGYVVLEERLSSIFEQGPQRRVSVALNNGTASGTFVAPTGWSVIDFALHPSGDITVALAELRNLRLVRLDRFAKIRYELALTDPQAPQDPYFDYDGGVKDDTAMVPVIMRDAIRLVPLGDDLGVTLRTGRNAVVTYRYNSGVDGYTRAWRTLVEPGTSMALRALRDGSFDTFGQLESHFRVTFDADPNGNMAVGVVGATNHSSLFEAHAHYFGEPIHAAYGILVTRLSSSGTRLGTTLVDTGRISEVHSLRAAHGNFAMVGRVFSEKRGDGSGWNAYAAIVDGAGGALRSYKVLDVDRGDALFDIAPLALRRYVVGGTTGYTQNPDGTSISEDGQPLLAVLEEDGSLRQRVTFPSGARQNQVRSLWLHTNGNWLVGGLVNGPGTHSGDAARSLITADGFVRETSVTVP
ncbi:MAG: hypothetical protein KF796_17540 [Ramlibacter sp.]|nr:hypothetical protein [Ramlibacter sp.]